GAAAVAGSVASRQHAPPGELCADGVAPETRAATLVERALEVSHRLVPATERPAELADRQRDRREQTGDAGEDGVLARVWLEDRQDAARRRDVLEARRAGGEHRQRRDRAHVVGRLPWTPRDELTIRMRRAFELADAGEDQRQRRVDRQVGDPRREATE